MKPALRSLLSLVAFGIVPFFSQPTHAQTHVQTTLGQHTIGRRTPGRLTLVRHAPAQQVPEADRWPVLSIAGNETRGTPVNGRAVGWSLERPYRNVTIAAHLGNGGGYATGVAYLMRAVGPGTSPNDEIAQMSFDLPFPFDGWITLFTDLELEAGEYWLVVAKPREKTFSSINWTMANPMTVKMTSTVRYIGTKSYTYNSDAAEYLPASNFGPKYEPYGFEFEVMGNEVPAGE